jgi:hypothetical protein
MFSDIMTVFKLVSMGNNRFLFDCKNIRIINKEPLGRTRTRGKGEGTN